MRFLHTADWHLGRLFHEAYLTEDQAYVLDQVVDIVKRSKLDALVVAGDIYDRAIPPPDAVKLLDDVLTRLAIDAGVPVILVAGNHDSPQRLDFGSKLIAKGAVHIVGQPTRVVAKITFNDANGPVEFYALPYAEPAIVRALFDDKTIIDHPSAMNRFVRSIHGNRSGDIRCVLIAHGFITGGVESESERPLAVGGVNCVDAGVFTDFNYVALGHLHGPQTFLNGRVRYSGSLLKYSISEATQTKQVNIVDMDAKGVCNIESIALKPQRDVRIIEGMLADVLKGPADGVSRDDYVHVILKDTGALLDVMGRIRSVYPNALPPDFQYLRDTGDRNTRSFDHTTLSESELFSRFFEQVTTEKLTEKQNEAFTTVLEALHREEREVVA